MDPVTEPPMSSAPPPSPPPTSRRSRAGRPATNPFPTTSPPATAASDIDRLDMESRWEEECEVDSGGTWDDEDRAPWNAADGRPPCTKPPRRATPQPSPPCKRPGRGSDGRGARCGAPESPFGQIGL